MDRPEPIGIDITMAVIHRLSSHLASKDDNTDEAELDKAFLLPAVEESIAQYGATRKRGFVLSHRIVSPFGFYYVAQADMERALKGVPESTLKDLTRALETYDPQREAVLILQTADDVQQIDIGANGELLLTGFQQRLTVADLEAQKGVPDADMKREARDLARTLSEYLGATTEAEARAILEEHPELLTDPMVETAWQQFWEVSPTVHLRITNRHKLWKRKRKQHARKEGKAQRAEPRDSATEKTGEIQWQPISQLPELASMLDSMYKDDQEQHTLYLEVREKPHVLDDATVNRAVRMYDERLDMIATMFGPQLERWTAEELTPAQRQEIERLLRTLADLKVLDEKIMALLKEIKKGTIDAVMSKSDFELGFEKMFGKVPLSDKQNQLAQKIDNWVKGIEQRGDGDEQILQGMVDYMATFKQIMDSSSKVQMDKLCAQYPGFYRFAMLLEDLARGIADGVIDVP